MDHSQNFNEPVAWLYDWYCHGELVPNWFSTDIHEAHNKTLGCHNIRPLYAAPVDCKCLAPTRFVQQPTADIALTGDTNCNRHPDAPHGLDDVSSYYAGYYVCLCQSWAPGEAS